MTPEQLADRAAAEVCDALRLGCPEKDAIEGAIRNAIAQDRAFRTPTLLIDEATQRYVDDWTDAAVREEREACAKLALSPGVDSNVRAGIAAAIRARGSTENVIDPCLVLDKYIAHISLEAGTTYISRIEASHGVFSEKELIFLQQLEKLPSVIARMT